MKLKKLYKRVFALLIATISFGALQAQTVSGTVTDKDGAPVAGVSVVVKNSNVGTSTDNAGKFTVKAATTATLIFSSVGFNTEEVALAGKSSVTVKLLVANNSNLNEVVVIGYGSATKKSLTGSVISIKAKDFNQGIIAAPDQLLQNKVAGLEVTNTSGQPGAATTIQIRGNSSIRSANNPLYVVDGVPLDGGTARPNLGSTLGSTPNSNPLLFIDPNNIAQIDVLKDAASAAIYGSRGANGVIVITTKKGTSGPMKMEIGTSLGFNAGYLKRFEILDAGQYAAALTKYNLPSTLNGGSNVDVLKEITQNTVTSNYSLALSGGNEAGRFRASFLGSKNQGLLRKSSLEKYIGTFGGNYKFLDNKLTVDFNLIAANYGEELTSVSNTAGSEGNIISSAVSWNPTQPLRLANGKYNFPSNGSGNPLAFSDAYNDNSRVNAFLGSISAAYKLTDKLEYKLLFGLNHGAGTREMSIDGWLTGVAVISGSGFANIGNAKLTSQTISHTLNYKSELGKNLTIDAVGGYEYFKTNYSGGNVSGRGFNTNLSQDNRIPILYTKIMQNAQTQVPYSTFANPTGEIQSFFGRATFNYKDKLVVSASMRADGSSKFGKNNRYGYFPAIGARWVASNEDFLKNSNLFTNLAIRASYGLTGNQEFPSGASQEQFGLNSYNNAPQIVNGNPDLRWETTNSYNIGADFAFAKGKIYGSLDYYYKNTSDILFQTVAIQPAPSSVSFVNLSDANLINSGVELALGANLIDRKNFGLEANFNIAYNKNMMKNFKDPLTKLDLEVRTGEVNGQGVSGTLAQVIANNQPVNVYKLKKFNGFDANGNQTIADNPTFAGDPNPKYLMGLSTSLRYNKFTLGLNMGGAFDFLIYNNTATNITNIAGLAQGRNIDVAAYESPEKPSSGVGASTRFLEQGNYFKLRNATLRYNLGNAGKYLKNVTAFVSGTNLFVITKFTGFDPEVNIDKSSNSYPSRSIEYVPYPTPRVITFGINFNL